MRAPPRQVPSRDSIQLGSLIQIKAMETLFTMLDLPRPLDDNAC